MNRFYFFGCILCPDSVDKTTAETLKARLKKYRKIQETSSFYGMLNLKIFSTLKYFKLTNHKNFTQDLQLNNEIWI